MKIQTITTPGGERLVVLPEGEFNALIEAVEDATDRAALDTFRSRLSAADEELVPAAIVDRLLAGENRIRVWREHRGLPPTALAERAGITQPFLSQIESGAQEGTLTTLRSIAAALNVTLDDLVGQ